MLISFILNDDKCALSSMMRPTSWLGAGFGSSFLSRSLNLAYDRDAVGLKIHNLIYYRNNIAPTIINLTIFYLHNFILGFCSLYSRRIPR